MITLNETKPFYNKTSYNQIRSDRNRNGGGLFILIKNSYLILEQKIFTNFEAVTLKLKINKKICNFIIAYKPPSTNNKMFIEFLEILLFT